MFHRARAKKQGRGVAPRPCSTIYFFGLPDPGKYCRVRNFATIADGELRLMAPRRSAWRRFHRDCGITGLSWIELDRSRTNGVAHTSAGAGSD